MNKKKVLLGLSGGVDSSVAALILKEQGYEVTAFTLKLWNDNKYGKTTFIEDAKKISEHLEIPHIILDYSDEFSKTVIANFISEYEMGRTPNPCVVCNKHIKFGLVFDKLYEMNYDYVATGHYSKIENKDGIYYIKKSNAMGKDQTYMHYNMTQEKLKKTLFVLGDYNKSEVREIALKNNLMSANKKDSQEICFIENDDYVDFLLNKCNVKPVAGNFIDQTGKVLGKHKGIINYTIGQRKGLGIALGEPMFVTHINSQENTVTLGKKGSEFSDEIYLKDVNFIPFENLTQPTKYNLKIRYGMNETPALVTPISNGELKVNFDVPVRAVTKGQSAVFYDGDYLIGGGIII